MSDHRIIEIDGDGEHMLAEHDGKRRRHATSYFRGEHTNFHPRDSSFRLKNFVATHLVKGLVPPTPFLNLSSEIVALGSCFASHISNYLFERGYNVGTKQPSSAYVTMMSDGIVNTFALLQQFEWAWEGKHPTQSLWYGYDAKQLGYDENVRLATKALFDAADCFIITFGLSEIWYDEPTGEVFWRAIPIKHFDPARHKFRVAGFSENLTNIERLYHLIRTYNPDARIILTLSPISLQATFRPIPCVVANAESKAILRAALGEFLRNTQDDKLFYFPSYEIVESCFNHPHLNDRVHVHTHVLDFNMAVFERYFCDGVVTDADLLARLGHALEMDRKVSAEGHDAVPTQKAATMPLVQEIGLLRKQGK